MKTPVICLLNYLESREDFLTYEIRNSKFWGYGITKAFIRLNEFLEFYNYVTNIYFNHSNLEKQQPMKKSEYKKIMEHLQQKLYFYQGVQTNSNRKTNFHGKKFHSVNAFEAAVRIQELNHLKNYVELSFKPTSVKQFLKAVKEFLLLKWQLTLGVIKQNKKQPVQ